jgi:hypothetical protein
MAAPRATTAALTCVQTVPHSQGLAGVQNSALAARLTTPPLRATPRRAHLHRVASSRSAVTTGLSSERLRNRRPRDALRVTGAVCRCLLDGTGAAHGEPGAAVRGRSVALSVKNQKGAPHSVGEPDRDRPVQRKHARLHPGVAVVRGAEGRQRGRGRRRGHARGAQRCFHQAAPARQRVPCLRRVRSEQLVTEQTGRWRAPGVRVRFRQALALQRSTTRPRKSPSMRWCNSAHPAQA